MIGISQNTYATPRRTSWSADGTYTQQPSVCRNVRTTNAKSAGKKKKRLAYNFKELSKQIMNAKTSAGARKAAARCRKKVGELYKKMTNSDYDMKEVVAALFHAMQIERVAKKHVKNLLKEEQAQRGIASSEQEQKEEEFRDELREMHGQEGGTEGAPTDETGTSDPDLTDILNEMAQNLSEELTEALSDDMEQMMEDMAQELSEETFDALMDDLSAGFDKMEPADLEEMKKKHRNDELRDINKADMKYLKALFDRLEQEKRDAASHFSQSMQEMASISFSAVSAPVADVSAAAASAVIDVQL